MATQHPFIATLDQRFNGILKPGQHAQDGEACVLEARNAALGLEWSDKPNGFPDIRPINDGPWESDQQRTEHMVPLIIDLWDYPDWSRVRQSTFVEQIALLTIQRLLPLMLRPIGLVQHADACANATTLKAAARAVARADAGAAARAAVDVDAAVAAAAHAAVDVAARAAARAAVDVAARADAAAGAGAVILIEACALLRETISNSA